MMSLSVFVGVISILGGIWAAIIFLFRLYRLPKFPKSHVDVFLQKAWRGPVAPPAALQGRYLGEKVGGRENVFLLHGEVWIPKTFLPN